MLYLPRLYVYHCRKAIGSDASEMLKVMERKLLRFIINPAMIATWIFGLWLAYLIDGFNPAVSGYWLNAKVGLVLIMQIVHAMLSRYRRAFANDQRPRSEKFFRILNEAPAVLLIGIVILVVIKPF